MTRKRTKLENPLVAFRCSPKVLLPFIKKNGGRREAWFALRRYMQQSTRKIEAP